MTEAILPPAPEAKITLDRERTLRCDMYAMRLFKKETVSAKHPEGISLLRGELGDNVNEDTIAELVWAFLVHEDAELTIDAVARMINPANMVGILNEVFGVILASLPEAVTGEDNEGGAQDGEDPLGETA